MADQMRPLIGLEAEKDRAAKPNTMVTLLTISKKVINAVRLMPSTCAGTGQLLLWYRKAP